jgi:signal transduction histidine kinase
VSLAPARDRVLRVLHVEASPRDHETVLAQLVKAGLDVDAQRVESEIAFLEALRQRWDIVLSDWMLPAFSALAALGHLRAHAAEMPLILVSSDIGDETATEAMRHGAVDHLQKPHLARLAPALLHAVDAAETKRAKARADRELLASKQRLSELAQHLQTSVEQERAAIAREIHDDVGGSLTALKFELAWIARHATSREIVQRCHSALETVTHAVEASQRIMHNLRPAILEQGLAAALHWIALRFERRANVVCTIRLPKKLPELPTGVPLVAYRTAQEALTNISKHARASRVRIDLSCAGGVLSLEISDNGIGVRPEDLAKARSFGIRGLHERAGTVGGWIDLSSSRQGTTLMLSVPLAAAAESQFAPEPDPLEKSYDPSQWADV